MVLMGLGIMFIYYKTFNPDTLYDFGDWIFVLVGAFLFLYGGYFLAAGLYNPATGVFRIDKVKGEVTIVDFLKSETIAVEDVRLVFYEIRSSYRPRTKYAMMCLRVSNGDKKDCFIVRSGIPIDIGRKVDKDLNTVARQLREAMSNAMKQAS